MWYVILSSLKGSESEVKVRVDRVEENVYVFVSELYAQVTATGVLTSEGAFLIDTMPFPSETRQIMDFFQERLGPDSIRYVVNTHHHADHVYGNCFIESAEIVAHQRCREIMARVGQTSLKRAKQSTPALADVELRLADITFQRDLSLTLGESTVDLMHMPGHTPDTIAAYVREIKALVASDTIMPIPVITSGSLPQLCQTLKAISLFEPDFVIQGHGGILLKGEVEETVDSSIAYLDTIDERVRDIVNNSISPNHLRDIDIEDCGISRIPLDGLVNKLHLQNLVSLYERYTST